MSKSFSNRSKKAKTGNPGPFSSGLFKSRQNDSKQSIGVNLKEERKSDPVYLKKTRLSDDFDDSFDLFLPKKSSNRMESSKLTADDTSSSILDYKREPSKSPEKHPCPLCLSPQTNIETHLRVCYPSLDENTAKALKEIHTEYLAKRKLLGVPLTLPETRHSNNKGFGLDYFGKKSQDESSVAALPNKWNSKSKKSHLLLRRTQSERENIITQKVALILMGNETTIEETSQTFVGVSSKVSSDFLNKILYEDAPLWKLSIIGLEFINMEDLYVKSFSRFISIKFRKDTQTKEIQKAEILADESSNSNEMFDPEIHFTQRQFNKTSKNMQEEQLLTCASDPTKIPEASDRSCFSQSYCCRLKSDWGQIFGNTELSDLVVQFENGSFNCHSIVLMARAKKIYNEIKLKSRETGSTSYLHWNDVSRFEGTAFLKFIYSGATEHLRELSRLELGTVRKLSVKYDIKDLGEFVADLQGERKNDSSQNVFESVQSPDIFMEDSDDDFHLRENLREFSDTDGGKRKSISPSEDKERIKKFKPLSPVNSDLIFELANHVPQESENLPTNRILDSKIIESDQSDCSTLPAPEAITENNDEVKKDNSDIKPSLNKAADHDEVHGEKPSNLTTIDNKVSISYADSDSNTAELPLEASVKNSAEVNEALSEKQSISYTDSDSNTAELPLKASVKTSAEENEALSEKQCDQISEMEGVELISNHSTDSTGTQIMFEPLTQKETPEDDDVGIRNSSEPDTIFISSDSENETPTKKNSSTGQLSRSPSLGENKNTVSPLEKINKILPFSNSESSTDKPIHKSLDFSSNGVLESSSPPQPFFDDSYLPSGHDALLDYNCLSTQEVKASTPSKSTSTAKNSIEKYLNEDSFPLSNSIIAHLDGGIPKSMDEDPTSKPAYQSPPSANKRSPSVFEKTPSGNKIVLPVCQSTPTGVGELAKCEAPSPGIIVSDTASPLLNYSNMMTPDLKLELRKYGLKPDIGKGKAKTLLRYIYDQIHPVLPASDKDPAETAGTSSQTQAKQQSDESDNDYVVLTSDDDSDEDRTHLSDVYNSPEEDEEAENNGAPLTNKTDLLKSVSDFIKSDKDLFEPILHYIPIWLDKFHKLLNENSIKCKKTDLMDVLDELCVTYRTEKKQRTAASRKRRKKK